MAATLIPEHLRCEYLVNPLGIDVACPRFSWIVRGERRAQRQSAYQILVADSEDALGTAQGDLWDSGRVESDQSVHIAYAGPTPHAGRRVWWAVRVWDGDGQASPYSAPAWWEMGLLEPTDWHGTWIGLGEGADDRGVLALADEESVAMAVDLEPSPYLRTTFTVARPIRQARLYVTARGLYEARLNGGRVGDVVLTPGWTDYRTRMQYQTYDVTDLLRQGDNALGVILAPGWYSGYVGFGKNRRHYGAHPCLLAQLSIDYTDGTIETVASDGSWRGATGPIRFSDLLMGEHYDARRELAGWDASGYDDAGWTPVSDEERDATPLVADRAEPVRVTEEVAPISITRVDADTQIVDLGQNIAGWVRLRARRAAGTIIQLRHAEILDSNGALYTENLRSAAATDTYIPRSEDEEVYEPRFTFHGFRYVEVTGYPGDLTSDDITGRVVESDTPAAGTFECSHPLINQLQRNIAWGQRGNFLSVPTDCPQRDERLGWLGDAQIFARTATCNRDVAAFFTKWMRDVADAQSPEGAFPDVAPRLVDLSDGAPAWGDAGVIVPWTLYQVYGDTRVVEEHYDAMARWLAYIGEANPDGLWVNRRNNDFGDWLALDGDAVRDPGTSATPKDLLATAYYAYDARLLARMARAIGRDADAARYADLFAHIRNAFIAAYVSDDGHVKGETQTGYVLALHMDLLPKGLRAAAATRLVERIKEKDWRLSTGFVGVGYLLPVLTEAGHLDVAYRLLLNDTFPSWGYSIKHGATTIWERWDGWTAERGFQDPGMNSFNHYSLGSVGEWLYRYVAGIDTDPEQPGFQHIIIRPRPGGELTSAKAAYRSVHGVIESAWQIDDGTFRLRVTTPANTTATVYLPTRDTAVIMEGDQPIASAVGVTIERMEDTHAVLTIGSGVYDFVVTLLP